jgi:hypothetical protein
MIDAEGRDVYWLPEIADGEILLTGDEPLRRFAYKADLKEEHGWRRVS